MSEGNTGSEQPRPPSTTPSESRPAERHDDIARCVSNALERYFHDLDGERPCAIYDMVLRNVERPMLEVVLRQAGGNQTIAATMLGINRNTLRKKLTEHQLLRSSAELS